VKTDAENAFVVKKDYSAALDDLYAVKYN